MSSNAPRAAPLRLGPCLLARCVRPGRAPRQRVCSVDSTTAGKFWPLGFWEPREVPRILESATATLDDGSLPGARLISSQGSADETNVERPDDRTIRGAPVAGPGEPSSTGRPATRVGVRSVGSACLGRAWRAQRPGRGRGWHVDGENTLTACAVHLRRLPGMSSALSWRTTRNSASFARGWHSLPAVCGTRARATPNV